jgi:hypothetical protein
VTTNDPTAIAPASEVNMSQRCWLVRADPSDAVVLRTELSFFSDHFVGRPMADSWKPPAIEMGNRSKKLKDFLSWMTKAPVVSACARDVLAPLAGERCEFLPLLQIKKKQYFAVNVLHFVDIVDWANSDVQYGSDDPTRIVEVRRYALHSGVIPDATIFKVPSYYADVFVTRPFVDAVIDACLNGVAFADPCVNQWARYFSRSPVNTVEGVAK